MMRVGAFVITLVAAPVFTSTLKVTPVQQVITMLEEIHAKGVAMMKEEQAVFAKYAEWVGKTTTTLSQDIIVSEREIEKTTALIDATNADVGTLGGELVKLDKDIATAEGDLADATKTRAEQKAEYTKTQQDYAESVEALKEAIQVLKTQDYDRPTADAFLQKMATQKKGMARVLAALIQIEDEDAEGDAPEVAAYEFQGGGVIAILEKLLDKFSKELKEVEEAEGNQAHQFDLESLTLNDMLSYSKAERSEKAALKSKGTAVSAKAVGALGETKADLAEDQKTKKEIEITFAMKKEQYEANQKVREDELAAISEATAILKDPSVSASYAKHVNLVQLPAKASPSFLQVRSHSKQAMKLLRNKAAELLRRKAKVLSSKVLADMATAVAANPFAKVITMIEDLLAKLKEDAANEKSHKEWCDADLKKNKAKREKKTSKVDLLTAEVADLGGQIDALKAGISKLSEEQAALGKAMAEATSIRTEEKATNEATIKDAKEASAAVAQATSIIKDFYASQAAFLQQKQVPEMAAYKGMGDAEGGVVGMLEVIASDFKRLETETTDAEQQAASEYAAFMADSKASTKTKHDLEFQKSLGMDQTEFDKSNTQKELEWVQLELDKATEYFEYLKPQCSVIHVSYEERAAKRKEEIAALKQAYNILDEISSS